MTPKNAFLSWSGGKDSALCLHQVQQTKEVPVTTLLTNMNSTRNRVTMHGVRRVLLEAQATAMGLPLQTVELPGQPGMAVYEERTNHRLADLKAKGCTHAVYGDIFLEDLKRYREEQVQRHGLTAVFPLWKRDTKELLRRFFAAGFKAIVVAVNGSLLDRSFCGRLFDASFLADLPPSLDPCGENGEFHTFVFDGPIFQLPVPFAKGPVVQQAYKAPVLERDNCFLPADPEVYRFYFCDLLPA